MNASNTQSSINCDTPVTIIVKRRPKPSLITEFENIMTGTTQDAMKFEGHLGANIIRPLKENDFYRIVFKFDSMRNYIAWENSDVRRKWMEKYAEVEQGEQEIEVLSGLETWFTLAGEEVLVPPKKYKMFIVTWLSIFCLSVLLNQILKPILGQQNEIAQIAIMSLVMVALMTYVLMPIISKILSRWLYCNKK
ncbi:MAG: antibiotic biosynthesis monooxygenase [Pseudomonadota bacterium]